MKELIYKLTAFLFINVLLIVLGLYLSDLWVARNTFSNWETRSNLLFMAEDSTYDLLVLGASTGRQLTRSTNHLITEKNLGKTVCNLSQGEGNGGLLNQNIYFQYWLQHGNTANEILYIINPVFFYNSAMDNRDKLFEHEPLRFDFMMLCIQNGIPRVPLWNYISSKFGLRWLRTVPRTNDSEDRYMETVDTSGRQDWIEAMYKNGSLDSATFENKKMVFISTLEIAKAQKMKMTVIYPPSLLGRSPGHAQVDSFLASQEVRYDLHRLDLTTTIMDPFLFYDPNHLNTKGVELLTSTLIAPALK